MFFFSSKYRYTMNHSFVQFSTKFSTVHPLVSQMFPNTFNSFRFINQYFVHFLALISQSKRKMPDGKKLPSKKRSLLRSSISGRVNEDTFMNPMRAKPDTTVLHSGNLSSSSDSSRALASRRMRQKLYAPHARSTEDYESIHYNENYKQYVI